MSINFNQLREFLAAIAQTEITELTLKSDDFELKMRKGMTRMPASEAGETSEVVVVSPTSPPSKSVPLPYVPPEAPAPSPVEKKWVEITSPMVGTFYRSPAPDEDPFVEVGDRIPSGQIVCIIEAMKLMNEIEAEVSGQVMEILVKNGEPVEYGQTLMRVNPE
ncbi:MAG: acetyl-CoA carboxylase biotin carboxyl carrier protein [Xenococcaceae cyanobacterium]